MRLRWPKRAKKICIRGAMAPCYFGTTSLMTGWHMLWLRTLGAVHLVDEHGNRLEGAASQRRLLALLSTLAVAGEAGLTRERLVKLLWPAGESERARHALTQSFYHARRVLKCDDLFLVGGEIRLNLARISSDVYELDLAVRTSDFARAAHLYGGAFLDEFVLPGSGEFDQWVRAQRTRISAQVAKVFDTLASGAEARAEYGAAVQWRRKHFDMDPLNSMVAAGLLTAMIRAGDRIGALQQARVHELMLKEELGAQPEGVIRTIVDRLRVDADSATDGVHPSMSSTTARGPSAEKSDTRRAVSPSPASRLRTTRFKRFTVAATIMGVVATALLSIVPHNRLTATVPDTRPWLVVAPFRVSGADASLGYLREGLVELLSLRLGDVSTAKAVDAGTVLSAWSATDLPDDAREVARARVLAVARRFDAPVVVMGSVVGNPRHLVISASLIRVGADSARADATVEGPSDSLTGLVNRLASKLIVASAGENDRFNDQTTPSPEALRAFLDGQSAYRRGDYAGALPFYDRALQLDSTFALAALHLALASDQINDAEQHDRALALAWAYRGDLSLRDRMHLVAFAGPRYPMPSPESEQLASWERAAASAPDRADVWYELGERLFHHGALLALRDGHERAATALGRALELDPGFLPARRLLVLLSAASHDTATLAAVASRPIMSDSLGDLAPALRWRVALTRHDQRELRAIRGVLPSLDDANLRMIGMASLFDGEGVEDGARALELRMKRGAAQDRVDAIMAAHALVLAEGRPGAALRLTQSLQTLEPGSRAHLRLRVLDALYGDGDSTAAEAAEKELVGYADAPASPFPDARALQLADMCVVEQWRVWHGTTWGTQQVISTLRNAPLPRVVVPLSPNQTACAAILEAMLSVVTQESDAYRRVVRLDSLMLGGPAVSDAGTYAHIVVARLYDRLGEPRRALEAIRNRTYMVGWPRYLATARREEGRLAVRVGDLDGAVSSYRRYLALRSSAESESHVRDDAVRNALAAVRATSRSPETR